MTGEIERQFITFTGIQEVSQKERKKKGKMCNHFLQQYEKIAKEVKKFS